MEQLIERKLAGKTKVFGEKYILVPLYPPQIPHSLIWYPTLAVAVGFVHYLP
jgi:hypothetical protein